MRKLLTAISLFLVICVQAQIDKIIPKAPVPKKFVNDYTNTLTPAQVQALEQKLRDYDDSTSSQMVIVMIDELQGYDIAEYGLALGRKWGIGGKEFNNGLIILIAKNDKRSRIEVGPGLEGAIPDVTAKSILDNAITPNFRAGNYYRGFDKATDDLFAAAAGEYKAPANYGTKKKKGPGFWSIIGVILMVLVFGGLGGGRRGGGGLMSGAGWIIGSMLAGSGRSGGGWSGGGGGGWSGGGGGFGGGSFGGGGASGSW